MKRILFVWDAAAFGGHDVSALVALEQLAGMPEFHVGALHTGRNARLAGELARIAAQTGRLEIVAAQATPCVSESLDGLRRGPRTRSLAHAIGAWRPDWTIHVQGFITLGLCALGACRALRIPAVSFLPMTHRIWSLQPSLVALLQDFFNRYWYSVPAAYIVTSERMKEKLVREQRVPSEKIAVVEYGPDVSRLVRVDCAAARKTFGLPDKRIIGVLGRVEFRQKRQDFLIRAVAQQREALAGFLFLVVGDGPDLPAAQALADRLGIGDRIRFLPWQQDLSVLYSALDAVLIPSRFEGVPLVMLEAMARRIPVLASAVDGMADFLPPECLFGAGDAAGMVARIRALPGSPGPDVLEQLSHLVETRLNSRMFSSGFAREILRLTQGVQP